MAQIHEEMLAVLDKRSLKKERTKEKPEKQEKQDNLPTPVSAQKETQDIQMKIVPIGTPSAQLTEAARTVVKENIVQICKSIAILLETQAQRVRLAMFLSFSYHHQRPTS